MLKQGLDLRIGQSLSMTPQMQQAIRLLQLSAIELEAEIQQALEENPLLQTTEDHAEDQDFVPSEAERSLSSSNDSSSADSSEHTELDPDYETSSLTQEIPSDLEMDADWGEVYETESTHTENHSSNGDGDLQSFIENQSDENESLQEHLLWQIHLSHLSALDKQIAQVIINNLDENGYLIDGITEIHARLADELLVDLDDVHCVLTFVQQLEPLGVAAQDLRECLLLQLRAQATSPLRNKAIQLVDKHLELIAQRQYKELQKRLKIDQDTLEQILLLLRTLQPKPGLAFSSSKNDYIVPDAYVGKWHGEWIVTLNPQITPALQINQQYAQLINNTKDNTTNAYLKGNLQQARWLIRSLEHRNSTLLRVSQAIVQQQSAFMQYGAQAMKPLVLRDVAEALELHESTISRVTSNKYLHTPRGVFELKYFFSSQLDTDAGTNCSSTAIRAMIKQLIDAENSRSPLSDSDLTKQLQEQGIQVARRTVAKYREAMFIPSSHERKTLLIS